MLPMPWVRHHTVDQGSVRFILPVPWGIYVASREEQRIQCETDLMLQNLLDQKGIDTTGIDTTIETPPSCFTSAEVGQKEMVVSFQ